MLDLDQLVGFLVCFQQEFKSVSICGIVVIVCWFWGMTTDETCWPFTHSLNCSVNYVCFIYVSSSWCNHFFPEIRHQIFARFDISQCTQVSTRFTLYTFCICGNNRLACLAHKLVNEWAKCLSRKCTNIICWLQFLVVDYSLGSLISCCCVESDIPIGLISRPSDIYSWCTLYIVQQYTVYSCFSYL